MILYYGDVSKLKGAEWFMVELRSERTIEPTMRRIGNAIPGIFREDPVEIFIPVFKRDLDVFEMRTINLIFVRSTNFSALMRLKSITGVVQLMTEGETNRASKAIRLSDEYVQTIIAEAEKEHVNRAQGIAVGSFVRILNAETRDFCGTVELIGDGRAIVRVILKTKECLIETPVRNLLNLDGVPKELQVYYYGPLVKQLAEEKGEEGIKLIAEDLANDESPALPEVVDTSETEGTNQKHTRQRTVTALVKKLILIDNLHEPMEIAKKVVVALKTKEIKAPKNLFIVYCIIKDNLSKLYFKKTDPSITNYREVIHKYGRKYKFSANDILKIDPELGIPVSSLEVCKDGRSREARQKQKSTEKLKIVKKLVVKRGTHGNTDNSTKPTAKSATTN